MSPRMRNVLAAAGVIVLVAGVAWVFWGMDRDEGDLKERKGTPYQSTALHEAEGDLTLPLDELEPGEKERIEPDAPPTVADGKAVFSGRVIDADTKEPITAFNILLGYVPEGGKGKDDGSTHWWPAAFESPEGYFAIVLEEGSSFLVRGEAPGYLAGEFRRIEIPEGEGLSDYVIELSSGQSIAGRVVDDATSEPVAGAEVVPFIIIESRTRRGHMRTGTKSDGDPAVTDAGGNFKVSGLKVGPHRLFASHPEYAESHADADTGARGVEIRLLPGFRFFGEVRDTEGNPSAGVEITCFSRAIYAPRIVETGPDGRYTTNPLPPGEYLVSIMTVAGEAGGEPLKEMQRVELVDRDVEVNFGPRPDMTTWQGTLFDGEGLVLAKATIRLFFRLDRLTGAERMTPTTTVVTGVTDEKGGFRIGPLDPGAYLVSVLFPDSPPGSSYCPVGDVEFERPGLIVRDLHMRRTEMSGIVVEQSGTPWRESDGIVFARSDRGIYAAALDEEGRFRFRSLPPGTYALTVGDMRDNQGRLDGITITNGTVIDDLRIVLAE